MIPAAWCQIPAPKQLVVEAAENTVGAEKGRGMTPAVPSLEKCVMAARIREESQSRVEAFHFGNFRYREDFAGDSCKGNTKLVDDGSGPYRSLESSTDAAPVLSSPGISPMPLPFRLSRRVARILH